MKIFFHTSFKGKDKYFDEYQHIVQFLKDVKHTVFSDHILKRDLKKVMNRDPDEIYREIETQKQIIKECDAVIVEASYPSIGVGYLIAFALEQHKSILVLYQDIPHAMLLGIKNHLLKLKKYEKNNPKHLQRILEVFLNQAEKKLLRIRFNMMLDEQLNEKLTAESARLHISKADLVRQMIAEKLNTNNHT